MTGKLSVLVTGAGGFLGTAICRHLSLQAQDPIGLDIADKPADWRGRWIRSPLDAALSRDDLLDGVDVVIHAAWTGFPGSVTGYRRDLERDVVPTLDFYTKCCAAGVSRFVFLSSGGTVYGNAAQLPIPETAAPNPISFYGASKVAAEMYLGMLGHATHRPPTILRLANPFGPGQMPWRGQGVVATAIACGLTGAEFQVWGSGEATRDYLFVDDAAAAVATVALSSGAAGTYNIGSGIGISLNRVLSTVEDVIGRPLTIRRFPDRKVDVSANVLAIDRIRQAHGWRPQVSFEDSVRLCHDWLASNESLWTALRPSEPVVRANP